MGLAGVISGLLSMSRSVPATLSPEWKEATAAYRKFQDADPVYQSK